MKSLTILTSGLANAVDDVNQYPSVKNRATSMAIELSSFLLINNMDNTRVQRQYSHLKYFQP